MRAHVVVDLGFGDAGKGLVTDARVRRTGAPLVVRYNGGAQAGHNVVTPDGRHHTFAQLGAGTFAGAKTWLSRHVIVHPTALVEEARVLEAKGVASPLSTVELSDRARLVTPYHQALNRLRELARGDRRHGSCGVGIGEAVADAITHADDVLVAGDLRDPRALASKVARVRARLVDDARALARTAEEAPPDHARRASDPRGSEERRDTREAVRRELAMFEHPDVVARWCARVADVSACVRDDGALAARLHEARDVVFEGAQGVLLDERYGFHPHTTWSACTAANALELLSEHAPSMEVVCVGVTRSHAVRHGAGPLPTETKALDGLVREHNTENPWQGRVRRGWLDAVLTRYALAATGGVDELVLTHVDLLSRLGRVALCPRYEDLEDLPVPPDTCPEEQGLTQRLAHATPVLEVLDADEAPFITAVERHLGRPIDQVSRGPTAQDLAAPAR